MLTTVGHAKDYNAGLANIDMTDPETQKPVRALVWYPTHATGPAVQRGPFRLDVVENAPAASGPHPLILLSHGNAGSPLGHRDTGQALAEAGFIVAAPLHAGDNFQDQSLLGTDLLLKSRPRSISALIDKIIHDRRFQADGQRIGFIGFSAGGFTGLALLGARPSLGQMGLHCKLHTDDAFCQYVKEDFGAPDPIDGLADPRIRAAVIMAPNTSLFNDADLQKIDKPMLLMAAEKDQILTAPYHAIRVSQLSPGVREFWIMENAQHFSFLAPFPEAMRAELGELAEDRPGFDRQASHQEINQKTTAFLEEFLY
ncbi:alpha/beta hydrolase family protein [Aestuariispira insulae]|nr:hypothetical protein [Aestuariispira insulae]